MNKLVSRGIAKATVTGVRKYVDSCWRWEAEERPYTFRLSVMEKLIKAEFDEMMVGYQRETGCTPPLNEIFHGQELCITLFYEMITKYGTSMEEFERLVVDGTKNMKALEEYAENLYKDHVSE